VDIEIIGANNRPITKSRNASRADDAHSGCGDVHVQQAFDAPTLYMDLDGRGRSTSEQARDVAQICSCRSPELPDFAEFLADPRNGVSYNVAVQTPQLPQ